MYLHWVIVTSPYFSSQNEHENPVIATPADAGIVDSPGLRPHSAARGAAFPNFYKNQF